MKVRLTWDLFSIVLLARSPLFVITATNGALISAKNSPGSDKKAGSDKKGPDRMKTRSQSN